MTSIETSDIVLAAALKVAGCPLDSIKKDGRRGVFCFSSVDDALVEDFNLGRARVEPVSFNNAVRALTTAAKRVL
jgi:hypothetical protein